MNITSLSNRWLNRCYKSIAVLLVLFAVLISALRLFLPYVENYRQPLTDYINERYQSKISIGRLTMDWHRSGPVLVAKHVILIESDVADISIENIDIRFNFWTSLRTQKLTTDDFILDGAKVVIQREQLLQRDINSNHNESPILEGLADLFMQQTERFSLTNSQVIINNDVNQRTFLIKQLMWNNIGERHLAKADVVVDGLTTDTIKLLFDVKGTNSHDMSGQLYLDANNLNITPWLDKILAIDDDKTDASINFNAWLTIKEGQAQELLVAFEENEISWQYQNQRQHFSLTGGQLLLSNIQDIQNISIETTPLQFNYNQQPWQPLTFEFKRNNDGFNAYSSYLDLASLTYIFPLFSADKSMRKIINKIALNGYVNDIYIRSEQDNYQLSANFSELTSHFSEGIPGIENSSGSILLAGEQLQINLLAEQGALDFGPHFVLPIPYEKLQAALDINVNQQGWQLKTSELKLVSTELTFSADLAIDAPHDGLAQMSLLASITQGYAEFAHHYFPLTNMSPSLVSYLKKGLVSGDIEQAVVLFNGPFSTFPFEDHSGVFTVDAELKHGVFDFDSYWPAITELDANLNFTNNSMMITGRDGSLAGVNVKGVQVGIADLSGEQVLTVDLELKSVNPDHISELMQQSSLKTTVGSTLSQLVFSGDINGQFHLDLPLNDLEHTLAQGTINFDDNQLDLQTPKMNFTHLFGQLTFSNDVINTQGLKLQWLGMPLALKVKSEDKSEYFSTNIDIQADWAEKNWSVHIPPLLGKYVQGEFIWSGDLALNSHHDGGFSYNLVLESALDKMQLTLPAPYNKTAEQVLPLKVNVSGQLAQSTLNLNLGEQLSFYGLLNHNSSAVDNSDQVYFSRAHLILGNEKMLLPMDGFHITTALQEIELASWQPFIFDILESIDSGIEETFDKNQDRINHRPLIAKPERIRGSIAQLDVIGQKITGVAFNFIDKQDWWLLQLNAKEARSEIKFYPDWLKQGVDIDADFIHLVTDNFANTDENTEPKLKDERLKTKNNKAVFSDAEVFGNMPSIRLHCSSCQIDNLDFGELSFQLQRVSEEKLQLTDFSAKRDKSVLTLNGFWALASDESGVFSSKTELSGKLSAADIEFEMEKLGYASTIKDSGIELDFSFDWPQSPLDFSLTQLNGELSARIDDGYLAEVSDKGVRVFSILSLGSLARKLKLDFRDIFSDGMFYSDIQGDMTIKQGVLYTDNILMNGTAGDLSVKGNTELASGVLDYRMTYKPNLTSSLPVLAWIATLNPVVFLTGLAINEVITSTVISEVNFELIGDIDNPELREVDRKTKDISVGQSLPPTIIDESSTINSDTNLNINPNNNQDKIDG